MSSKAATDPQATAAEPADPRTSIIHRVREAAAAWVEDTSLRGVAREVGLSPTGLKKFLQGTAPYSPTLQRLRSWYVRHLAEQPWRVAPDDAATALGVLLHELTPAARQEAARWILESLSRGYESGGEPVPAWIPGALARLHPDPAEAP